MLREAVYISIQHDTVQSNRGRREGKRVKDAAFGIMLSVWSCACLDIARLVALACPCWEETGVVPFLGNKESDWGSKLNASLPSQLLTGSMHLQCKRHLTPPKEGGTCKGQM